MNKQDRIADPGFTAAMDQTEAAINELRALGVPYGEAMKVVNRVYSVGLDRGLHCGLRLAGATAA
ncbi:hypothetical protein [Streptomyces sp. S1D4-14]|uniref:hypothetical protein n=1 Tax=Streptomyces sp. S1D4-14 TaxID=2594461 RepID=UPI001164EDCB|nr:hypothetical protein [Streptomyces sp. S1D4-14]QDN64480.1 hypothetical protein FNV66_01200 [Streptomyces sp. S1D4-14]